MPYIYNDEDNAPMNDFDSHNPTVYTSLAEAMNADRLPFNEPEKPDDGCWNCIHFDWDHEACSAGWNNYDDCYYNPDTDDRDLMDHCDMWEEDPDADPECLEFGGNEP